MRIVGGKFRGRVLASPDHAGLRPTADRVREAVFNILLHGIVEFEISGARVIDLFAGTGALGIEALSRGAAYCLFVEESAEARALIRTNIEALGLTGATKIFRRDATELGAVGNIAPFDLAFLDPPYAKGLGEAALKSLREGGWLAPDAVVVLEERAHCEVALPQGFAEIDRRIYGESQVVFGRYLPELVSQARTRS
jgi:16S rRNA (guanine966-N2)-methyltransferase